MKNIEDTANPALIRHFSNLVKFPLHLEMLFPKKQLITPRNITKFTENHTSEVF